MRMISATVVVLVITTIVSGLASADGILLKLSDIVPGSEVVTTVNNGTFETGNSFPEWTALTSGGLPLVVVDSLVPAGETVVPAPDSTGNFVLRGVV